MVNIFKRVSAKVAGKVESLKNRIRLRMYGYNRVVLDTILELCYNRPVIELAVFHKGAPKDAQRLIDYLAEGGMIKLTPRTMEITVRGIIFHEEGGFCGKRNSRRFWNAVSLAALACAILALFC